MTFLSLIRNRPLVTWILALVVALTALALYLRTLQPTLGGMFNSEEYQQAAYALGLAHSTGYPLYLLLGKLFITIVPVGDPAYRMNLFSAVWAAGAAVLVFLLVLQLTSSRAASLLGALFFVTNEAVWRYASVAEVDTMTAFLASAVFLSLLLWRKGRTPLELSALLYGLALVHHRTSIFYGPGIVIFVLLTRRDILRNWAFVARLVAFAALPLLVYLYVPLRAFTAPDYVASPQQMLNYLVGLPTLQNSQSSYPMAEWPRQADLILRNYLWNWFAGVGIILAVIGYVGFPRSSLPEVNNATRWLILPPFFALTFFSIPPRAADIDRYLLIPVLVIAIGIGLGAARVFQWLVFGVRKPYLAQGAPVLLFLALLALPIRAVFTNLPNVDYSQNDDPYLLWTEIFDLPLEQGALIVGNWSETNSILYMQRVEGRRPDVKFASIFPTEQDVIAAVKKNQKAGALYLAPGTPSAGNEFHYTAVGPLLRVMTNPVTEAPRAPADAAAMFDSVELIGYGLGVSLAPGAAQRTVKIEPGASARLNLDWRVVTKPEVEYDVRLRLLDSNGRSLWQRAEPPLRGVYPSTRWRKGNFVSDSQLVYIPPGTPPGKYRVQVALLDGASETVSGETAILDGVEVVRGRVPLADQVFVQQRVTVQYPNLELLGYSGGRNAEKPGNDLNLAIAWRAEGALNGDYALQFTPVDPNGDAAAPVTTPLMPDFPTSRWLKDDAFKGYYTVPIPADAQAGKWGLKMAIFDGQGKPLATTTARENEITLFQFEVQP